MPTWLDKILNSQSVQFALAALAFLIALWLVVVIARMMMGGRLRLPGGRSRQPRLGIVDAFDLDRQRQLIIVRRDNTEHLIMIGGPNDLLIESEILRVEAREFRDGRRDKMMEPVLDARMNGGDGRIPAPMGVGGNGDGQATGAPRADEPLLPMSLPQTAQTDDYPGTLAPEPMAAEPPVPARAPTFPLPPRRPTATPTIADRRPPTLERAPSPVERVPVAPSSIERAPAERAAYAERPQRGAEPSLAPGANPELAPAASAAPPPSPDAVPPPAPGATEPGVSPGSATPSAADRFARPQRPAPYLKPLPPRPPLRPLRRITPQAEPAASPRPAGESAEPTPAVAPTEVPSPVPVEARAAPLPPNAPPSPPVTAPAAPPQEAPPAEKDALESLEEEMAKLLGRGN